MSSFKIGFFVILLATALSTAAYAAAPAKGGGGHAAAGGGGGGHAAGGGGHPGGGGGGRAAGGGAHFGGGGHAAGGGAHFGGGGGARHISAGPAISHSSVSRSSASRSSVARPSVSGSSAQPNARGNRSATRTPATNSAGQRTLLNSTGNTARNANPNLKSHAVRSTLNSASVAGALRNRSGLRNAGNRARITASAATAGWHNGRDGGNGWWRHGNGGYGWVGPLYWPFAYYDMYNYAMWGNGYDDSFWGYGYGDIYAGIFAPYGYDDLTGYLPQYASSNPGDAGQAAPASGAPAAASDQLTQMCGDDSRDIAGLPIDQFQQAIQPAGEQAAALDDLANASLKAAQNIKAACPSDIALTAPSRLAAMQKRIEAMIAAVQTVQPPLERFYGLLNDEQKAKLTALGNDQRQSNATKDTTGALPTNCGAAQPGVMEWPAAEIDQTVRPTDAQRASLTALQNATSQAADLLKTSCTTNDPLTPPARLAAVGKRLDSMLQAVKIVSAALNDFYGTLSDEQKARFEAIGPQQTSQLETLEVAPTTSHRRRYGRPNVDQIIRRLMYRL
jgi:hypothetical protein